MRTATGLTLIALGAILAFAVSGHPSWLNIQVVGWVIMATGVAGTLAPARGYAAVRSKIVRRRPVPGGVITEIDEQRYPPYIHLNSGSMLAGNPGDIVASREDVEAELTEDTLDR
jgi:hypothetical protein